jgi:hypothetical protein
MGGTSKKTKSKTKKAPARKSKPAKPKSQGRELREDELEKVAGGAAYMKYGTIEGEVLADKFDKQIELESYSVSYKPRKPELTIKKW